MNNFGVRPKLLVKLTKLLVKIIKYHYFRLILIDHFKFRTDTYSPCKRMVILIIPFFKRVYYNWRSYGILPVLLCSCSVNGLQFVWIWALLEVNSTKEDGQSCKKLVQIVINFVLLLIQFSSCPFMPKQS